MDDPVPDCICWCSIETFEKSGSQVKVRWKAGTCSASTKGWTEGLLGFKNSAGQWIGSVESLPQANGVDFDPVNYDSGDIYKDIPDGAAKAYFGATMICYRYVEIHGEANTGTSEIDV